MQPTQQVPLRQGQTMSAKERDGHWTAKNNIGMTGRCGWWGLIKLSAIQQ